MYSEFQRLWVRWPGTPTAQNGNRSIALFFEPAHLRIRTTAMLGEQRVDLLIHWWMLLRDHCTRGNQRLNDFGKTLPFTVALGRFESMPEHGTAAIRRHFQRRMVTQQQLYRFDIAVHRSIMCPSEAVSAVLCDVCTTLQQELDDAIGAVSTCVPERLLH